MSILSLILTPKIAESVKFQQPASATDAVVSSTFRKSNQAIKLTSLSDFRNKQFELKVSVH